MRPIINREQRHWLGSYRGLQFRIVNEPRFAGMDGWWAEISIPMIFIPDQEDRDFLFFEPKIAYRDWWIHYSPDLSIGNREPDTYHISALYGAPSEYATAEIGWDYCHYWDNTRRYDENIVLADICKAIDDLKSRFKIYSKCHNCGKMGDDTDWVSPDFGEWPPIHPDCCAEVTRKRNERDEEVQEGKTE